MKPHQFNPRNKLLTKITDNVGQRFSRDSRKDSGGCVPCMINWINQNQFGGDGHKEGDNVTGSRGKSHGGQGWMPRACHVCVCVCVCMCVCYVSWIDLVWQNANVIRWEHRGGRVIRQRVSVRVRMGSRGPRATVAPKDTSRVDHLLHLASVCFSYSAYSSSLSFFPELCKLVDISRVWLI